MFLGHLAAGLALKARVREAPLSWLLFATVLPDLLCGFLLLIGLEHVVVEGPFVFGRVRADIGYSHSLLASLAYAVLAGTLSAKHWRSPRIGVAFGLAVLSHFVLDALSHRPDMPVLGFGATSDIRLGTNLALYPLAFFLVELAWCLVAFCLFDVRNRRLLVVLLVLMGLYTNTVFGFVPPPPLSAAGIGIAMIIAFSVTTGLVFWAARGSERVTDRAQMKS